MNAAPKDKMREKRAHTAVLRGSRRQALSVLRTGHFSRPDYRRDR